mgnify:CR=1 FL=1
MADAVHAPRDVRHRADERGSVTVFVAVLGAGLVAAAGLAYDGAAKLGGLSEARELADNTARACAQGISPASVGGGAPELDLTLAESKATDYLARVGSPASTVTVGSTSCTVTIELTVAKTLLPGEPFTVSATETADVLYGVEAAR